MALAGGGISSVAYGSVTARTLAVGSEIISAEALSRTVMFADKYGAVYDALKNTKERLGGSADPGSGKDPNEDEGTSSTYSNYAKQATKNPNSMEVVLGKYNQGGVSYTKVAEQRGATYFQLDNWDNVVKNVGEKNIWNINEAFIRQQASAGKTFILSHDPAQATGYFAKEVNLLKDMGYSFIKEGSVWRALK